MSYSLIELDEIMLRRNSSINPSKFPNEIFELHSIPAFDTGTPEILEGSKIGSSKQCIQENDVMISKIVPHIRRASVVCKKSDYRQIASGEWIIFRNEKIYPHYLKNLLISDAFNLQFMSTVSGVGGSLLRARPAFVSKIKIPLPPLEEQRRIAEILDKADALIQNRKKAIEKLDELLQATFIDMFGDPVTNPKGWIVEKLGKNILHANNGLSRRRKESENVGDIVLRLQDVHYNGIHFEKELNRIRLDDTEKNRYLVDVNDILFIRVNGNPEYVGRSAIFLGYKENIYHNDHLIRLKIKDTYNPLFLVHCLNSDQGKQIISKQIKTSAGQHTISQSGIFALDFYVPNKELQDQWANFAQDIEKQKQKMQEQLEVQETLFKSLQQQAFNGQL